MTFSNSKQSKFIVLMVLGQIFFGSFTAQAQTPLVDAVTGRQVQFTEAQSDIDRTRRMYMTGTSDPRKITHCYHYISEKQQNRNFLTAKYTYAQANSGHFFIPPPGPNNAVAGPGVYCAKTLVSTVYYGDRVLRIELSDDVVILDRRANVKYCRHGGDNFTDSRTDASCAQKKVDLKYYEENYGWYVITTEGFPEIRPGDRRVRAIKEWSAEDALLISDLQQTIDLVRTGGPEVLANPSSLTRDRIVSLLQAVQQKSQRAAAAQPNGAARVYRPVNAN